jgi:hypothetical protein
VNLLNIGDVEEMLRSLCLEGTAFLIVSAQGTTYKKGLIDKLSPDDVLPILENMLDDQFTLLLN